MRWTLLGLLAAALSAATPGAVTFNKDVAPILQRQCQGCHRPGEVAPMAFLTYKDTRPWAKAIKESVLTKKMPPWFADAPHGRFKNERRLSDTEVKTLAAWADGGALEGAAKDLPAPVEWANGWSIGKPDIIVEMPRDIEVPATGDVDQQNVLVKVNFPKDVWVKAAEVRPGNPRVVHHMKAWVRFSGSPWMSDAPEGVLFKPRRGMFSEGLSQDMLAKFNPGVNAQEFTVGESAKFIPAGSDIVFECHYVTVGTKQSDRSRVGIVLADAPPRNRYLTVTGLNNTELRIPAGAPNHEVRAVSTMESEAQLVWVQPHMHMRAKDYELRAVYPSGETEVLLKVPRYRFDWQLGYEWAKPVTLPKGTRLETVAHYDNSPNNAFNPDPKIDVAFGPQSTDEMAVSFMGFVIGRDQDPSKLVRRQRVETASRE